jgi:dTDP-4-amino-4,6-dideoxygalactose transaminase
MIPDENVIPSIPFWIRKQLHKPCWNLSKIIEAVFTFDKEKRIIYHIKKRTNARAVILTSSGSNAIETYLKQLAQVINKTEVIMPSYCCKTVADSIINCGLIPHFIDVENDFMISIQTVSSAINKNTLAIIAPHMYGKDGFFQFIKAAYPDVVLIEDKAAKIEGKLMGDVGILSFNIGKQVQSVGGGALLIK